MNRRAMLATFAGAGLAAVGIPASALAEDCVRYRGHFVAVRTHPLRISIDGVRLRAHHAPGGAGYVSALHMFTSFGDAWDVGYAAVDRLGRCRLQDTVEVGRAQRCLTFPEVTGRRVRKNVASLTRAEREAFVAAVFELKRAGTYDMFVQAHVDQFDGIAHFKPSFLPWHRAYLYHFETELMKLDRTVTLPYWDWTADREYGKVPFTADLLGGPGRPGPGDPDQYEGGKVTTGPFAHDNGWELTVNCGDPTPYLKRKDTLIGLPTARDVDRALAVTPYDVAPDWLGGFRYVLDKPASDQAPGEGLHSGPHNIVGGHMSGMDSPNDPTFWLHHCMLDRIWAQWQERYADQPQYLPENPTPGVLSRYEPMQPWCSGDGQVTPHGTLDHTRFANYE